MQLIWIAGFGITGVLCRYWIDLGMGRWLSGFPLATLLINLLGSALAGAIYVIGTEKSMIPPELRTGIMVGFLGGFTTFSAYALQSARLLEERAYSLALLYFFISPVLGLMCAALGMKLARLFP